MSWEVLDGSWEVLGVSRRSWEVLGGPGEVLGMFCDVLGGPGRPWENL